MSLRFSLEVHNDLHSIQLLGIYIIIALAFWVSPTGALGKV